MRRLVTLLAMLFALASPVRAEDAGEDRGPIVVASKPFGESYLLAEMFAQLLDARGIQVERRPGLGATEVAFEALRSGAVDVFPEYTGTALVAILHDRLPPEQLADPRQVYAHVSRVFGQRYGMRWLAPLGFQNTYAIAVRRDTAARFGLTTLSDLARHGAELRGGFTADFISRPDGLAGLVGAYGEGIRPGSVQPLAPAVKYQALASGGVDVIDGYSTDGLLARYDLVTLTDDKHFFPPYEAAALLSRRAGGRDDVVAALGALSGRLDEATMRRLNRRVEVDGEDVRRVAAAELRELGLVGGGEVAEGAGGSGGDGLLAYMWSRSDLLFQLTLRHLWLVAIALAAACALAIPLGLWLERRRAAATVLGTLAALQTIPSIALLAFMVPLLGIGAWPALVALWLYALYPIARATFVGVRDVDRAAIEAAEALGATPGQRLRLVRLPLAAPFIMAGVRTAAVITVGAATLAAFIGAGGLGEPIVEGLALADARMILSGAIPAALLALAVDGALALVEARLRPAHLRARRKR